MSPASRERDTPELSEAEQVQQFIKAINQALVLHGWSQRVLCDRIGCRIGTLTKYLRGTVAPLKVGTGIQAGLAEVLGVTLDALVAYYRYGVYATAVALSDVESWIRSDAGQADLPVLMASLEAAGRRWVGGAAEPIGLLPEAPTPPPYTWPLEEIQAARLSDGLRERLGLTDADLEPLVQRGEFTDELAEAFAVACGYETEEIVEAFTARSSVQ